MRKSILMIMMMMIIIIIIIIIIQDFMYRDAANVEPEMYDYTTKNWRPYQENFR